MKAIRSTMKQLRQLREEKGKRSSASEEALDSVIHHVKKRLREEEWRRSSSAQEEEGGKKRSAAAAGGFSNRRMTRSAAVNFSNRRMTRSASKLRELHQPPQTKKLQTEKKKKSTNKKIVVKNVVNELPRGPRLRYFTREEHEIYEKKFDESEGFDVGDVPQEIIPMSVIRPASDEDFERLKDGLYLSLAETAILAFNKRENTKWNAVKLTKVNGVASCCCTWRYITFQANDIDMDASVPLTNFQARMRCSYEHDPIVELVRLEPQKTQSQLAEEGPGETSQQQ